MSSRTPVTFGLAGLGGYAGSIRNLLLLCSQPQPGQDQAPVRLAAICEPAQELHAHLIQELSGQGIRIYPSLQEMLQTDIEAVWLPVPIDLHRPFTEAALAAGKAVMCEKPAAGCIDDLDAMIRARQAARRPVAIGFQDIYDQQTLVIKRRLAEGVIGQVTHAVVRGLWARGDQYYNRNSWAGRLKRNGVWVLDSPANNALAHYINLPLFWLGPSPQDSAQPLGVDAELYRARAIESFDTCSMRIHLSQDRSLLVLYTHACARHDDPLIEVHGTQGRLIYRTGHETTIFKADGSVVQTLPIDSNRHRHMVERFVAEVRGQEDPATALATLEVARAQLLAINGAAEATAVRAVPAASIVDAPSGSGPVRAIAGIEEAFAACARDNRMLHEIGRFPWTTPAGHKDLAGYTHFGGPKG